MARITSIVQNGEFYYKLALDQLAEDNYGDAIPNLIKAALLGGRDKYLVELAEAYSDVGSYHAAVSTYVTLLAANPNVNYLLAIARNFILMDADEEAADFALKSLMSLGNKLNEKRVERLEEVMDGSDVRKIFSADYPEEKGMEIYDSAELAEDRLMDDIEEAYERRDFDKAISLSLTVPKDSENHLDALEIICLSAIENGDKETALKAARELYSAEPGNLYAMRAFIETETSEDENKPYDFDRLVGECIREAVRAEDDEGLRILARTMLVYSDYEKTAEAARAALSLIPENYENLSLAVPALFLKGDKQAARTLLNRFASLYPRAVLVKLYKYLADKKTPKAVWKTSAIYFPGEKTREILIDYYDETLTADGDMKPVFSERAADLLDMILFTDNYRYFDVILSGIIFFKPVGGPEYIEKKLIDYELPAASREEITRILLKYGIDKELPVLLGDRFTYVMLKSPEKKDGRLAEAYIEVYLNLINLGFPISPRLLIAAYKGLEEAGLVKIKLNVLSCLLHCLYNKLSDYRIDLKGLAEFYKTNLVTMKKYFAAMGIV
jgi:hypothetical protein